MGATETGFDYAVLTARLNLPSGIEGREEQIMVLQCRRADQLAALAARDPMMGPTASMLRLRATQQAEVDACEEALRALGAPFDLDTEEPE